MAAKSRTYTAEERLLTTKEAAEVLGLRCDQLYELAAFGTIASIRVGTSANNRLRLRFRRQDIEAHRATMAGGQR